MLVFLLMNVETPTIVGVSTFMSSKIVLLSLIEHDFFYNLGARYLIWLV